MRDATRGRLRRAWRALNRRRRPGTFWIEFGVLVVVLSVWFAFTVLVYSPGSASGSIAFAWFLIPYVAYWAWAVWFRNRGPEEPTGEPHAPTYIVAGPGMVDPMQLQAEWAQRQRRRWETRSFRLLGLGITVLTVGIFVVGVLSRFYLLLAVAAVIAVALGTDWWRYSPHARRSA